MKNKSDELNASDCTVDVRDSMDKDELDLCLAAQRADVFKPLKYVHKSDHEIQAVRDDLKEDRDMPPYERCMLKVKKDGLTLGDSPEFLIGYEQQLNRISRL